MTIEVVGGHSLSKADALLVDAALRQIAERNGRLDSNEQRKAFIEYSRPAKSPTHHIFPTWDPGEALERYLDIQAGRIIREVSFVITAAPEVKYRKWPVVTTEGKKGYFPMQQVMAREDLTKQVLEQALADLDVWQRRYDHLRGLAEMKGVFAAVDKVVPKRARRVG